MTSSDSHHHTCLTVSGSLQHSVWINNSSRIVKSDYVTFNGVIHYIDKLLRPYTLQNVASQQSNEVCRVDWGHWMQHLSSNGPHRQWLHSRLSSHLDEPHRGHPVLWLHSLLQTGGGKTGTGLVTMTLSPVHKQMLTHITTIDSWPMIGLWFALQAAGLIPVLTMKIHKPFTMLWPTDKALNSLPASRQQWLFSPDHQQELASIVKAHIIRSTMVCGGEEKEEEGVNNILLLFKRF